jgi:SAM-dependent methyltransferase
MSDYDSIADQFIAARSERIGRRIVRAWSRALPRPGRVLDLGCGHGVPNARELVAEGLDVHGVDASPRLVGAFRTRVPEASCEVGRAENVSLRVDGFDGVLIWGLLFLLAPDLQQSVVGRASRALRPRGAMLITAPLEEGTWTDALTGAPAQSLGEERYRELFSQCGLRVHRTGSDEGGNHFWWLTRF